jgi:hypothetical protein
MRATNSWAMTFVLTLGAALLSHVVVVVRIEAFGVVPKHTAQHRPSSSSFRHPSSHVPSSETALSIGGLKKMFGGGDGETATAVVEKGVGGAAKGQTDPAASTDPAAMAVEEKKEDNEEGANEVKKLFAQIKDAGVAGSISLFLWEGAFWAISIPVAIFGYNKLTGHWPDLSDTEDLSQVGAEAFAFANVARLALPVRIGLAISTTPWVQENIVDKFLANKDG